MTETELELVEVRLAEDGTTLLLTAPDGRGHWVVAARPFFDFDPE